MDPQRPLNADSVHLQEDALNASLPQTGVDQYGNWLDTSSLEGTQPGGVHTQNEVIPAQAHSEHVLSSRSLAMKRRSVVVSLAVTIVVTLITGASILGITREAAKQTSNNQTAKSQDVKLNNASIEDLPNELQGTADSLLVNGDIITRGDMKISKNGYVTILRSRDLTSNQTFTLPNGSGTLCLDSNNCSFAGQAGLNQTNNAVAALRAQLGQLTAPTIPAASLVNNQAGAVAIQGTSNQISVSTSSGTITLAGPQDLAPISSPTFAGLVLNGNLSLTGTIALPINCSTSGNGGALTTDGSGSVICSADDGGASGAVTSAIGGTAGTIPVFTSGQNIENSLISQAPGVITINGSLNLTTALSVANGGTGTTSFTANGLLVGNGAGAVSSTNAASNGTVLLGNGTTPTFTALSGDIAITGAGSTTIQADSVALGVDTTGNYVGSISAGNGIGVTGAAGEGSTHSLSVLYGAAANTAVQGNTSINCASGTGNLSGGGNTFALGSGGTCSNLTISNSPTFTTSITTPQLILTGAGSNGTLQLANIGQLTTYILPDSGGASTTICIINNNCNYQVAGSYVGLQATTPGTAQTGNINIDGTIIAGNLSGILNGVVVSGAGTSQFTISGGSPTSRTLTVTSDVALNQNLLTTSNVTFNQLDLATALAVSEGGTGLSSAPANGRLLIGNGSSFTLNALASADSTVVFTNGAGTIDLSVPAAGSCGGCANTSLSNLSSVAINTSLLAGGATIDLGSTTAAFRDVYIHGSGSFGTNSFRITGTPSGNRTITLPSLDGTVVLAQTIGSSNQQTGDINLSGTVIAGTAIQGTLLKTPDGAGATAGLTIRSGNSSGLTSGNITLDAGMASTTAGTISIGDTNATALTLGRSGVIASLPGGLSTSGADISTGSGLLNGQTISASANFTGSVAIGTTLNVNTITPLGALTVGATSQNLILQGATTSLSSTSGASSTTLNFGTPTANVSYVLQTAAAGTYNICTTAGNCAGAGNAVTESGSIVNRIPYFDSATNITSSNLEQTDSDTLTVIGNNSSVVIQGGTAGGTGDPSLVLGAYPNTTGSIQFNNEGDTGSVTLVSGTVAAADSYTLKLPTALDVTGKCLSVGAGGQIGYFPCVSSGGGGGAGVTGSGTTGQLVRWTDGALSVVSDSVIQDNGSRVGVNVAPDASAVLKVGTSGVFKVTNAGDTTTAALTVSTGGASINGGLDNTSDGITNTGAISGATTITASGLLHTTASSQALTVSGTPTNSATQSLIEIGNAIAGGNTAANGGTYIGLNQPNSGVGSAADFLNFQKNGVSRLLVANTGDITAGKLNGLTLAQGASQFTINGGTGTARTLTVTGDATINQDLSTTSSTVAFGKINNLTTKLEASQGGTGSNLSGSLAGAVAIFNATTNKFEAARLRSSDNSLTITSTDGDVNLVVQSCSSCANTSLSNLTGTTAINSDLLPQSGKSIGSATSSFQNIFLYGAGTFGSTSIQLTGTPTGNRVLTLPDVTANFCVSTNNCGYQSAGSYVLLSPGSQQTGFINISGNAAASAFNSLSLTANMDGFSVTGGATARTLTVTSADVTLNQSLQTVDSVTFASLTTGTITTLTAGTANAISIQPGISSASNGTGAGLTLRAGDQSGTTCNASNCTGGSVTITGGNASGGSGTTRNGGNVTIDGGTGAAANGSVSIGTTNALSVSIGRGAAATTLQGNASSSIIVSSGSSSTTVSFVTPTANVIYQFDAASAGTYQVCTTANLATTCLPGGGGGNYVQNQYSTTQNANFNIQSADSAQVSAVIKGAASQSVDILQIATSTSTVFKVGPTGTVSIGNVTNGVTFGAGSFEPILTGNARHLRTINLTAEYAGAVLDGVPTAGGGSDANIGTLTAGFDSTNFRNYYNWSTSQTSAQTYDLVLQVPVPSDWSSWAAGGMTVRYNVDSTSNASVSMQVYGSDNSNDVSMGVISTSTGWQTSAPITLADAKYSADGIMTIRLRMNARTSGGVNFNAKVANITLTYNSKY